MTANKTSSTLETRIHLMEDELKNLRSELIQARVDQWEGRIDELELQVHLGSMEANDRLVDLIAELRSGLRTAKAQAQSAGSTTVDVLETIRDGLEQAMKDVRDSLIKAKETVSR